MANSTNTNGVYKVFDREIGSAPSTYGVHTSDTLDKALSMPHDADTLGRKYTAEDIDDINNDIGDINVGLENIKIYVGEEDGKLHFVDSTGADTVIPFSKGGILESVTKSSTASVGESHSSATATCSNACGKGTWIVAVFGTGSSAGQPMECYGPGSRYAYVHTMSYACGLYSATLETDGALSGSAVVWATPSYGANVSNTTVFLRVSD